MTSHAAELRIGPNDTVAGGWEFSYTVLELDYYNRMGYIERE